MSAQCNWHDTLPCTVPIELRGEVKEWNGRHYCALHMPFDAGDLKNRSSLTAEQAEQLFRVKSLNGIHLPGGSYELWRHLGAAELHNFTFQGSTKLKLIAGPIGTDAIYDFRGSTFGWPERNSRTRIVFSDRCTARFDKCTVIGNIDFNQEADQREFAQRSRATHWSMKGAKFFGTVSLQGVPFEGSLDICGAIFHAPVLFSDQNELPQSTYAHDAIFKRGALKPDAVGSYRSARLKLAKLNNRELAGVFYALEKRSHRAGLHLAGPKWNLTNWISRPASALYDYSTKYGQSFERALAIFMLVQFAFGFAYAWKLDRLELTWRIDWPMIPFTLAQVAKPFELFTGRTIQQSIELSDAAPDLVMLTLVHSTLSLILIALFLMALRWRFKIE